MSGKSFVAVSVAVIVLFAGVLLSCGHSQQLVSLSITPSVETFGSATTPLSQDMGASVQLRALGTYIHPPAIKDITDQVTWSSNTPGLATVSATGVLSATGLACGGAIISATVTRNTTDAGLASPGALVTGTMTANVVCFSGPTISLFFAGTGTGSVSSSPVGLGCAQNCSAQFPSGSNITLTAIPNGGSTFAGWAGCTSAAGTVCSIENLTSNINVTATFN